MEVDGQEGKERAESRNRVAFEIEDEEFQELIVRGKQSPRRRRRRRSKSDMCTAATRVFCFFALLAFAIFLLVLAGLYWWREHEASVLLDTAVDASLSLATGVTLLEALQDEALSIDEKLSLLPKTNVHNKRMISLYSSSARQRVLDSIKERRRRGTNFTFLASGGSTTAGAGPVLREDLYFAQFAQNYLSTAAVDKHDKSNKSFAINIVDRGHGSRDSFHSALLAESFFPPDPVDLIVWEFAMNDEMHRCSRMEPRNPLLFWLLKLKQFYLPHPTPPVILVYYWASPMSLTVPVNGAGNYSYSSVKNTPIFNPVFDVHNSLAADFDFVIGHVNVAAYLDTNMGWNDLNNYRKVFLAESDDHHPNALGHALTARMMQELMTTHAGKNHTVPVIDHGDKKHLEETPLPQWFCGVETKEQQRLKHLLLHSNKENGPPITSKASFVADFPRNAVNDQLGSLGLTYRPNDESSSDFFWKEVSQGKASEYRHDRQNLIQLPNCHREGRMVLEVMPHLGPVTALALYVMNKRKGKQASKAKLWREVDGDRQLQELNLTDNEEKASGCWIQMLGGYVSVATLKIWVNGVDYSDQLIDTNQWKDQFCQLTNVALYHRWLILDDGNIQGHADKNNSTTAASGVTLIELCDASTAPANSSNALALEHIVVL
jgi:hypothetical protein